MLALGSSLPPSLPKCILYALENYDNYGQHLKESQDVLSKETNYNKMVKTKLIQ